MPNKKLANEWLTIAGKNLETNNVEARPKISLRTAPLSPQESGLLYCFK